jgi:hypothetical protein
VVVVEVVVVVDTGARASQATGECGDVADEEHELRQSETARKPAARSPSALLMVES